MKLLLLLFFTCTTPFVLFIAALLYGGITADNLKRALSESNVYTEMSAKFAKTDSEAAEQNELYSDIVSRRFTPEYIKSKAESAIDESADWITGKTQTPPVVSFKELKDDIIIEHPALLTALQSTPTKTDLAASGLDEHEQTAYLDQTMQISTFIDNDFTVPLGRHLGGLKTVYSYLQFALPILVLILVCCIFMIIKLPEGIRAKFIWLGGTFLICSIVGYGSIFVQSYIIDSVVQIYTLEQTELLVLMTPIMVVILSHYLETYTFYQGITNAVLLAVAAVCFVGALFTIRQAPRSVRPLNVKDTFWRQPLKK